MTDELKYDLGKDDPAFNDLVTLGGSGAGDIGDPTSTAGLGTDGITLNYPEDPGLDTLTTGNTLNTNIVLTQLNDNISKLHQAISKMPTYKPKDYVRAVPLRNVSGSVRIGLGEIAGWSFRETAGQQLAVDFYDGADAGAAMSILSVNLPANGDSRQWLKPDGVEYKQGLYMVLTGTGVIKGAIWLSEKG